MTDAVENAQNPGRGRPRSEEADRAIMAATIELLMDQGFSSLSIEAVAAKAGVGKTTIYRRWPGKTEMVIAAMSGFMHLDDVPDTGTLRGDLLEFHANSHHGFSLRLIAGGGSTLVGTVLSEKERNPELIETFRRLVTDRRREQFKTVIDRARVRGEVGDDADPDYVASVIFGTLLTRTLAGMPVSDEIIEQTVDNLLNGLLIR